MRAGLFGLLQRGGQRGGGRAVGGQRVLRGGQPGAGLLLRGLGFVQGGLGGSRVGRFGCGGGLFAKGFGFAKGDEVAYGRLIDSPDQILSYVKEA